MMPFTASSFERWPVDAEAMRPHYEAVSDQIPFAAEEDDLAADFPLIGAPAPLPQMSRRSRWVLDAYDRHRAALNGRGITMGKARLAFDPASCVRCGLCMTGCPYGLIYSAAQTFDALERSGRVTHHSGFLVLKVMEEPGKARGHRQGNRDWTNCSGSRLIASIVACGAIGTTRLVANSLDLLDVELSDARIAAVHPANDVPARHPRPSTGARLHTESVQHDRRAQWKLR